MKFVRIPEQIREFVRKSKETENSYEFVRRIRAAVTRAAQAERTASSQLEARQLKVFASDVSPGGAEQHVIAHALSTCKLAIILATNTYGYCTNALFCTSAEMNYIIGQRKPYYLVRMIPFDQSWAEPTTTMAFPQGIMFKVCSLNPTLSEQRPPTCVCMPVGARSCGCQATRCRMTWSTM